MSATQDTATAWLEAMQTRTTRYKANDGERAVMHWTDYEDLLAYVETLRETLAANEDQERRQESEQPEAAK